MKEIEELNIPAFQRKKSLDRKMKLGQKKPSLQTRKTRPTPTKKISFLNEVAIPTYQPTTSSLIEFKTVGFCERYFDGLKVAIVKLSTSIKIDDRIIFEKEGGLFEQKIESMQVDRAEVSSAAAGSKVGIKMLAAPKSGTPVYKHF